MATGNNNDRKSFKEIMREKFLASYIYGYYCPIKVS